MDLRVLPLGLSQSRTIKNCLLGALLSFSTPGLSYQIKTPPPDGKPTPEIQLLQQMSRGISQISEQTRKALVFVSISKTVTMNQMNPFDFFFGPGLGNPNGRQQEQKQKGLGSGFFIDIDKGYIITNNHVIAEADTISVKLANGMSYEAKVLGKDPNTDVAVVQIKDSNFKKSGLSEVYLANSEQSKIGELVLAAGAPFGLEASFSLGVISATNRDNLQITAIGSFIQTDAAINPGNSGGPLLNVDGQVVGMNTAIFSRTGASAGIGFAVPSNIVREVSTQLIAKGKVSRGYLGVNLMQNLDEDITAGLNLPEGTSGALVGGVRPDTPAAKSGLEAGDVIIAVDNKAVEDNQSLTTRIGLMPPGTKIDLTVLRDGKKRNVSITLAQFPDEESLAQDGSQSSGPSSSDSGIPGLRLSSLSQINGGELKRLKQLYKFSSSSGVLIASIDEDSLAYATGMRVGDVIVAANKRAITQTSDLVALYKKSDRLILKIERQGSLLFLPLRK